MVNRIRRVLYYVPKKFLIKIIFALFMFCCFLLTVKAETINNVSSSINQACSTNNRFTYSLYGGPEDTYSTGTFKSTYSGKADYLVFSFDYDLLKDTSYSLSISAISTDFRSISKSNTFLEYASDCATTTGNIEITNLSFSKSKIVISFKTTQNTPYFILSFGDPEGPAITGVSTFGISSIDITTIESNDTQNIIDNQNQNANAIIDNQQQNTQDIIDNQNKNNEELKDTINDVFGNECKQYSVSLSNTDVILDSSVLHSNGDLVDATGWGVTDYIEIFGGYTYNLTKTFKGSKPAIVFYDGNKNYVSGISFENLTSIDFTLPENVKYFRLTMATTVGDVNAVIISSTEVCINKIDETNDKLDNLNDSLNNSNVDDNVGSSFFNDFTDEDNGGISGIIKAPLVLINSLLGSTNSCNDLSFPILSTNVSLPCGSLLWSKVPSDVLTIYHTIICGYLSFILLKKLYKDIEDLKNPNDSEVKTTDL